MHKISNYELRQIEKPARYVGGEYGQIIKDKKSVDVRFALCFPDIYDIGMSNLGLKILYHVLNKRKDTWCERVYAPWPDFEKLMRKKKQKLYAMESKDEIDSFDIIGFTLQYEMSYTNILNMLDLADIPVLAKDRQVRFPFIVAGGPCACNPYPLAPFIDIFLLGDGEELIDRLAEEYHLWKQSGNSKKEFLNQIRDIQGIFIPSIHTRKSVIKKAVVNDLTKAEYPTSFVVPSTDIVQDKITLEVMRGCQRGCRFCQAGYIYRPVRERAKQKLVSMAKCFIHQTGINEITLSSLSTSDYSDFIKLAEKIIKVGEEEKVSISLPSLRIDSINKDILMKVQEVKRSSLTFAPEAGSQRLRDVINKNITEQEILSSCRLAFENGWTSIKLYFMIGLPTETYEDLNAIVELTNKIIEQYYSLEKEKRRGKCSITVSTSTFVPKPHTPFEWCTQDSIDKIEMKQKFLKEKLSNRLVKYAWHDPYTSRLEALVSRGDEKIANVIYTAWKNGATFDSWESMLNREAWEKAIVIEDIDVASYLYREFPVDHKFVWDHIFHGVSKRFLKTEYQKAIEGKTTPKCSEKCSSCGISDIAQCPFIKERK